MSFKLPNGRSFNTDAEVSAYQQGLLDGSDKMRRLSIDLLHSTMKNAIESDVHAVHQVVAGVKAKLAHEASLAAKAVAETAESVEKSLDQSKE